MSNRYVIFMAGFLAAFCPCTFSQVITVEVNRAGTPFIKLDGSRLRNETIHVLPVTPGKPVFFEFEGIVNMQTVISVKGTGQGDASELSLDSNYFKVSSSLASDERLVLKNRRDRLNLADGFIIAVHNSKSGMTQQNTFIPQAGMVQPGVTRPATTHADGEPEEELMYQPGSAVYDALKLVDAARLSGEELKIIVKYYFPDRDVDDVAKAVQLINSTPFLKDLPVQPLKADRNSAQSGGNILSTLKTSGIGGLDVTTIVDGLAKFLVKRTKQELSNAFFDRFAKVMRNTPDLQSLFPNVAVHLHNLGEEVYDYHRNIQNLREAFKADVNVLHFNLPQIINNHPAFFKENHGLAIAITTGCYFAQQLEKETHPGDILASFPTHSLDRGTDKTLLAIVRTMQLLSASLRDTLTGEEANYWVGMSKVRELVNSKAALRAYLGLIYRECINRYQRILVSNTDLATLLEQAAAQYGAGYDTYDRYKNYILDLAYKTEALNRMIKDGEATDTPEVDKYARYFRTSVELLQHGLRVGELPGMSGIFSIDKSIDAHFSITNDICQLVAEISRRNYSAVVNRVVSIYSQAFNTKADSVRGTAAVPVIGKIIKYGSFMATLATSENSDEVAEAIELAAMPVGSSKVKRESLFNVAVNAYTGLFLGHESISGIQDNRAINTYGVTAPLGISLSRGHSIFFIGTGEDGWRNSKKGWSTSLFISLIDIGAVTAYRFKSDQAAEVPTIQLKNIVSPGAFLSLGLPGLPLSFNMGVQTGPNLRRITGAPGDFDDRRYWRFSTAFCVDIPLFNLFTRSR